MKTLSRFIAPALAVMLAFVSVAVVPLKHTAAHVVARATSLEKKIIQEVSKASVQLGPVMVIKDKSGKEVLRWFGWGSGTLISKDGLIITNNHVFDTSDIKATAKKAGGRLLEDRLIVLVTKRTDQPPVAAFIATGVYNDPRLDLAVLKITQDLSGQDVNADDLNLPFVPLGNSDEIDLGDKINIFGYPGIGGDTITFTEGPVSGFASDPNVKGGRGWIKTSATIAGGNSGGTGVDDTGKLIGIPTRGGAGETNDIVDCRPVTDTNGDGSVDNTDTCVPIGGFINSLRPVNVAATVIEKAQNVTPGEPVEEPTEPVDPQQPTDPVDDPVVEGVIVTGHIEDASTGKPLANAVFVVLNEGIKWADSKGTDDEVYESVKTDRKGYFEMTKPLQRGVAYSMGIGAKGYKDITEDDVTLAADSADTIEVRFELTRQ